MKRILFTALLFGTTSAGAQSQQTANSVPPAKRSNADRIICETVEDIGSRLGGKRVCMTQQQWEERRRHDREDLEDDLRHQRTPG
ncbi:MAG: hypothetical protein ABI770_08275 [Sphingomicrobium sp.]